MQPGLKNLKISSWSSHFQPFGISVHFQCTDSPLLHGMFHTGSFLFWAVLPHHCSSTTLLIQTPLLQQCNHIIAAILSYSYSQGSRIWKFPIDPVIFGHLAFLFHFGALTVLFFMACCIVFCVNKNIVLQSSSNGKPISGAKNCCTHFFFFCHF